VQVVGVAWREAMRIVIGVGDLVQRTGDDRTGRVLSGQTIGWSGDVGCVCTVYVETRSVGFLVEPQNQGRWFVTSLASKTLRQFSLIWSQNWWVGFPSLGLKTGGYGLVIWTTKSPRRFLNLCLKIKQAMFSLLRHETDGRVTA
jgi:hypothetical protein